MICNLHHYIDFITSCVFPLTLSLKNTFFSYVRIDQLPRWVFPLTFRPKNTRHVFFRLLFLSKTHFSISSKRNHEFSVIKSSILFTKQLVYATLNSTRISSFSTLYFIQKYVLQVRFLPIYSDYILPCFLTVPCIFALYQHI